MGKTIEERAKFDFVRYANCWEDADILCEALRPGEGKRILSIASSGDNSLALLADGASVVAADLSSAQLACVELRRAAFRGLDHLGVLSFLGVRESDDRPSIYDRLRGELSGESRRFWDAHPESIESGIIHHGKFEDYFRLFRTRIIPLIHSRSTVDRLLSEKDDEARHRFYRCVWNNRRWRWLFRIFFSRFVMGRLGRDREFFRYVEGSVSDRLLDRACHALTVLPTHVNPYLKYILTGTFGTTLPRYLEPDRFDAVRQGLDRLTIFRGPIDEAEGRFDGFNLSDIFEYLDPGTCETIYDRLLKKARPGARLAYWNMLAPRSCPMSLSDRVRPLPDLSASLFQKDRAFFYSAFLVEEVR